MQVSPQAAKLKQAVQRFQERLERDVDADDPQQVHDWVSEVRAAFDELDAVVDARRARVHQKLFREIGDQDATQEEQIRELRNADEEVDELLEIVKSQLIVLSMRTAADVEPRIENQVTDDGQVLDLVDRGIQLVHWIQDQEESVSTWFAEVFASGH